jgi:ribosomal protein L30/L7E
MQHVITLSRSDFSDLGAAKVPSEISVDIDKCHGRGGDMVVVQVKSQINAKSHIRDSLRSLGLSKPNSKSLRESTDSVTRGLVHTAREYVAVAILPVHVHKKDTARGFESVEYGSATKPAEIWRTRQGSYIGYELSPPAVAAFLSTESDYRDVLVGIQEVGLRVDPASEEALLVADPANAGSRRRAGHFLEISKGCDLSTVSRASIPCLLGKWPAMVYWRSPYRRFHDIDRDAAELAFFCRVEDRAILRTFKQRFAEKDVISLSQLTLQFHEEGRRRDWTL